MRTVLGRFSLRLKLVAAVLAIVAAALTGISVASVTAMQEYLIDKVDDELQTISDQLLQQVAHGRVDLLLDEVLPSAAGTVRLPSPYVFETRGPKGLQSAYPRGRDDGWPRVPTRIDELRQHAGVPYTVEGSDGLSRWRLLIEQLPDDQFLVIGRSLADVDSAVERLSHLALLTGLVVLGASGVIAVAVVWASLRPLGEIERTATAIAAGDMSRRVPAGDPRTEVGRLARVLNMTFNQIETAFQARARSEAAARRSEERMRRFVADASHELRSPLTTIRGFAELHRHGAISDPAEIANVMRRIEDEARRMGLLVEDLLLLARLDQQRPIAWEPVDLLHIAVDTVTAARAIDPDRPIDLVVGSPAESPSGEPDDDAGAGPPVVMGDEARLRQVLDNLVRNALIHTPKGTRVEVRVRAEANAAVLEVADEGPGLDAEQAERVFERFYRADPARSRRHGSSGLGLAIVAALAAAHGGRAGVVSSPGKGATFWVRLPLAPEASQQAAQQHAQEPSEAESSPVDGRGDAGGSGEGGADDYQPGETATNRSAGLDPDSR